MTKQTILILGAIAVVVIISAVFLIPGSSDRGPGAQQPSPHALDQSEGTNPG
jgi:hypothetical protein